MRLNAYTKLLISLLLFLFAIAAATMAEEMPEEIATIKTANAKLYHIASINSMSVGSLTRGAEVVITEFKILGEHVWFKVTAIDDSVSGWVRGTSLEFAAPDDGSIVLSQHRLISYIANTRSTKITKLKYDYDDFDGKWSISPLNALTLMAGTGNTRAAFFLDAGGYADNPNICNLTIFMLLTTNDILLTDKVRIKLDNDMYEFNNIVTDQVINLGYNNEYILLPLGPIGIEFLHAMAQANTITVRLDGVYSFDFKLTNTQAHQAFKSMYNMCIDTGMFNLDYPYYNDYVVIKKNGEPFGINNDTVNAESIDTETETDFVF